MAADDLRGGNVPRAALWSVQPRLRKVDPQRDRTEDLQCHLHEQLIRPIDGDVIADLMRNAVKLQPRCLESVENRYDVATVIAGAADRSVCGLHLRIGAGDSCAGFVARPDADGVILARDDTVA